MKVGQHVIQILEDTLIDRCRGRVVASTSVLVWRRCGKLLPASDDCPAQHNIEASKEMFDDGEMSLLFNHFYKNS